VTKVDEREDKYTGWFYRLPTSMLVRIPALIPLSVTVFIMALHTIFEAGWSKFKKTVQKKEEK